MESLSSTRRRLIALSAAGLAAARLPRLSLAQDATPAPSGADDGSLGAMLTRAYDPIPDGGSGPTTLFAYANVARQLEVRGLRRLDQEMADDDRLSEWIDGVDGLYLDDLIVRYAFSPELWEAVGFGPAQVAQTMTIGDPPQITRIYRGNFDGEAIFRALDASGYDRVETDREPVMSSGEAGEFSIEDPFKRLVLANYNNAAVVDDAYVVTSPFIVNVESALAVFAGNEASLANNRAVQTLTDAVGEELVSAVVIDGGYLSAGSLPDFAREGVSTPVPAAVIPPAAYALFGITPGSMPSRYKDEDPQLQGANDDTAPRSVFVIALHLGSEAEAVAAVPVIEGRFAEGVSVLTAQPYTELLGEAEVAAVPGAPVVTIRIKGDRVGRLWLRLVFGLDLVFIFTE